MTQPFLEDSRRRDSYIRQEGGTVRGVRADLQFSDFFQPQDADTFVRFVSATRTKTFFFVVAPIAKLEITLKNK